MINGLRKETNFFFASLYLVYSDKKYKNKDDGAWNAFISGDLTQIFPQHAVLKSCTVAFLFAFTCALVSVFGSVVLLVCYPKVFSCTVFKSLTPDIFSCLHSHFFLGFSLISVISQCPTVLLFLLGN